MAARCIEKKLTLLYIASHRVGKKWENAVMRRAIVRPSHAFFLSPYRSRKQRRRKHGGIRILRSPCWCGDMHKCNIIARWTPKPTISANWDSHKPCVLDPSALSYRISDAFEGSYYDNVKHRDQKAFGGGVSHNGFPACVACIASASAGSGRHGLH